MRFDWDENKAAANRLKHGVSFREASTVFEDQFHIVYFDTEHSIDESRFIVLGESAVHRLLVVSYVEKRFMIRIISARQAARSERNHYEEDI